MTSVSRLRFVLPLALLFGLSGCGEFAKQADKEFGDQHFKSAIALIELHKVRFGVYPEQLSELRFTGAWDATTISCVKYKKVEDGYELDLVRGWEGIPELSYPPEFWRGLGLRRTNIGGFDAKPAAGADAAVPKPQNALSSTLQSRLDSLQ